MLDKHLITGFVVLMQSVLGLQPLSSYPVGETSLGYVVPLVETVLECFRLRCPVGASRRSLRSKEPF